MNIYNISYSICVIKHQSPSTTKKKKNQKAKKKSHMAEMITIMVIQNIAGWRLRR
jgi:hypothetical protein